MNDATKFILKTAGAAVVTFIAIRGLTYLESSLKNALAKEQAKNA